MKASELINKLVALISLYGDSEVEYGDLAVTGVYHDDNNDEHYYGEGWFELETTELPVIKINEKENED